MIRNFFMCNKKEKNLRYIFLLLFLCFHSFIFSEKTSIKVGWFPQPSFIQQENYETPSGYVQVYLEHIAQYTDWEYEYVKDDFAVLYQKLLKGEIDILPCLFYTEERDALFNFSTSEMGALYSSLFVRSDNPLSINEYSTFSGITVAAERDENPKKLQKFAEENGFSVTIVYYDSLNELEQAVINGETDAGVVSGFQETDETRTILDFAPSSIYFGVPEGKKDILSSLNRAMSELKIVNPFFDKDLMSRFIPQFLERVELSNEEKDLISTSRTLTVAISNTWKPFEYFDKEKNEFSGLIIDIYAKISELTDLSFTFIEEDKIHAPTADIIASFPHNMEPAQEAGYKITEPYLFFPLFIISTKESNIQKGKTGIIEGLFPYHDFNIFKEWDPVRYPNHEECLKAVLKGDVDQVLINSYTANFELRKTKYRNLYATILHDATFEICSAVSKELDPTFFYIINRALTYISNAETNDLIIRNTLKSTEISLRTIIDEMPLDVILLFVFLSSVSIILIILYSARNRRRILEAEKNKQLRDALIAAEKANSAKGQFTSRISHEIRSPLNAVIGYMNIAKSINCENARITDCLIKGEYAAKHLLSILNDVLDMSSIESGKIHISHVPFNIKEIITSLTMLFYSQAKQKNIDLTVQLKGIENEILIGDKLRLTQILANLLSNAIKFTPKDGAVSFTICEGFTSNNTMHVQFEVKDSGIGMKKEFLERIFNPFEQQDNSISSNYGGSGLGLSITKNLVNLMDGAIQVESEENIGAKFTVTIPFSINTTVEKQNDKDFSSLRAIVIHDDSETRNYIQQLIENCGIESVKACSITKAYQEIHDSHLKNELFDICFLDVNEFSHKDIEVVTKIRKTAGSELLIIVVSAYEHSHLEKEGLEAGVNRFISKPLFRSTMFNMLHEVFGSYTPVSQNTAIEYNFKGKKVLLAEDNEMNTEIAVEILKRYNIETICSVNGQEAFDIFNTSKDNEFSAILMDIQMPILDGYAATKKIRNSAHPCAHSIPIIAMTANAFAEDISLSLASGMNNHISKPIDINELIQTLSLYLIN